jgi:hypothetical protein
MTDDQLVSLSWCQAAFGSKTRFLLLSDSCRFVDVGHWEDGAVIYNCCWPFPVQSFLGPSLMELTTIFYCLRFEAPPTWRARSLYLYPPRTGWPNYTPAIRIPSSLPPMTCRAKLTGLKVKVKVNLQLVVYCQSVRLSIGPLETHDQRFFFRWTLVSYEYAWSFVKCTFCTCSMLLKILWFALHTSPLTIQALQSRSCLSYVSYATGAA